jgi:uncharacterized membrane protein
MSTGRLEAFSDGVIAVAITLLVLDLRVPLPGAGQPALAHGLGQEWPRFVAYAVSFVTIGIIWINHHATLSRLREADHTIMILNLFVLLSIGLLPFATSLMATYLNEGQGQHLAAALYAGAFLVMSCAFSLLNWQILLGRPHLLAEPIPEEQRRRSLRLAVTGWLPYVLATALAPVSPYVTLAICGAVAVFYALPISHS